VPLLDLPLKGVYITAAVLVLILGFKLSIPDVSASDYQNKMYFTSDVIRFQNDKSLSDTDNLFYKEYP
jgi:hypothetical protein